MFFHLYWLISFLRRRRRPAPETPNTQYETLNQYTNNYGYTQDNPKDVVPDP